MTEHRVDPVEKALSILELFSGDRAEMSLEAIAQAASLPASTADRLIGSLARFGHLVQTDRGAYRLGPSLWCLGARYRDQLRLAPVLRPVLEQLVKQTGETASFFVIDRDRRLCLFRHNSADPMRHHLEEGVRYSLNRGAAGHVLAAACLDRPEAKARLEEDGICISDGESYANTSSIAIAVENRGGRTLGALALSYPNYRFDDPAQNRARTSLKQMQKLLQATL